MKRIDMYSGLIALLCLASCTQKPVEKQEEDKFTVTSPLRMDTSFVKSYVSQIKSVRNIELRAQEKGYLEKIYVDEGQTVKAGQLLFKINSKVYEAELHKAEAEARSAEIELKNSKTLADKNVVSRNEQLMSQSKLDEAKAEVAAAKLHLSFTDIRAPFDGTIDRIPLKLGSLVAEGDLLTSLSDNTQMFAYFNVSEPEYLDYQQNVKDRADKKVTLLLANNQPFEHKGNLELIEGEFNNETGNIAFRARFPNPDKLLRNGETGEVQMVVPLHQAIVIPQKTTYEIQDKKYVFVVDNRGVVKSRNITVASEMPDLYVISAGLSESDKIVLDGVQKVKDDQKIKYEFQAPAPIISQLRLKAE